MVNSTVTSQVSPVTLKDSWSRSGRLIWLVILSTMGCIGNIFQISSIMIDDYLKKTENCLIVSIAFADFLMTSILMPISSILLLSGVDPSNCVCKIQWFLTVMTFLTNNVAMAVVAVENYTRVSLKRTSKISQKRIIFILFLIWTSAISASFAQIIYGYDYCSRKDKGSSLVQLILSVGFVFTPLSISCILHSKSIVHVKRLRRRLNFKPSTTLLFDYSLVKSNTYSLLFFVIMWFPFITVFILSQYVTISNEVFYMTAWVGILKSCMNPFIYCSTNRHFRNAFVRLFNYCCLKTNIGYSRRQRAEARVNRDVRVHIIPGYNMYSPPRRARNMSTST